MAFNDTVIGDDLDVSALIPIFRNRHTLRGKRRSHVRRMFGEQDGLLKKHFWLIFSCPQQSEMPEIIKYFMMGQGGCLARSGVCNLSQIGCHSDCVREPYQIKTTAASLLLQWFPVSTTPEKPAFIRCHVWPRWDCETCESSDSVMGSESRSQEESANLTSK